MAVAASAKIKAMPDADTRRLPKPDPIDTEKVDKATRTIDMGGPHAKRIYDQMSLVALVLDNQQRVVRFNAAAERALGKRFDEVLGKPCFEVLPDLSEIGDCKACERVIAMGVPTEVKDVEIFDHSKGRKFIFDFQVDPIVGDDGKLAGVSMIGLDVTERFKLRRRLARHNEDLKTLHDTSNALRKTMDLDKGFMIIASALTSEEGGGYDKALILVVDQDREYLKGRMAVDSLGLDSAHGIWRSLTSHDGPLDKMLASAYPVLSKRWGDLTDKVARVHIPVSSKTSLLMHAMRTTEPVTHETPLERGHEHLHLAPELTAEFPMTCFAAAPLKTDQDSIGVIIVDSSSKPRRFSPERLNMLKMFASQAALAINNGMIFQNVLDRAQRDSLTRLYNHGHFQESLRNEIERAKRYNYPVSLVMLDIDHFKKFNDNYGHQTGDMVLKQTALVMTAGVRVTDMAARYGGEEFALLLPQTNHEHAMELATRMCAGVGRKVVVTGPKGERLGVTASFGVSTFPEHAESAAELVSIADEALYYSKRSGRNQVRSAAEVLSLPQEERDAIKQKSGDTKSGTTVPPTSVPPSFERNDSAMRAAEDIERRRQGTSFADTTAIAKKQEEPLPSTVVELPPRYQQKLDAAIAQRNAQTTAREKKERRDTLRVVKSTLVDRRTKKQGEHKSRRSGNHKKK
jgi:diguanylate cyclase (GGDEF)-like protein/PAS domain S-box-containing protein